MRLEFLGSDDGNIHPGGGETNHVGVRHVVTAIPQVHRFFAFQARRPLFWAKVFHAGLQVGEELAGVECIRQGVDDGHGGRFRHISEIFFARRYATQSC